MSFDPKESNFPNYEVPSEPKSSGKKKWWLIGGCGCMTVLLLCCGGIGAGIYWGVMPVLQFTQEQIGLAEASERVAELLGENPRVDQEDLQFSQTAEGEAAIFVFRYGIRGEDAEGTLVVTGKWEAFAIEAQSLKIEIEGQEHDLDPDAEFNLDIDDGGF